MIKQSNEISLKDAIEKMLHTYKLKGKVYEAQIVQAWARIVGTQIEKQTYNIYLKNNKLFIKIGSAAIKHELSYARTKIRDRVNEELGANVVEEVILL